ncbi:hypothetical protein ACFRCW_40815 [Streptomyces sp. NPDC056653]|uniref:hypothetical protein n=1 Tax=Streptomyces sp. NPDC056653 TaxID=3345894 RepID=UPI00367B547C
MLHALCRYRARIPSTRSPGPLPGVQAACASGVRDHVLDHDFFDTGGFDYLLDLVPDRGGAPGELTRPVSVGDDGGYVLLLLTEFPRGLLGGGKTGSGARAGEAREQGGPGPAQPLSFGVGVRYHGADGQDRGVARRAVRGGYERRSVMEQGWGGLVGVDEGGEGARNPVVRPLVLSLSLTGVGAPLIEVYRAYYVLTVLDAGALGLGIVMPGGSVRVR